MTQTSEQAVVTALAAVLRDHGWLLASNPARLRATLSDILGADADEHRGAVDAIVVAADEGIPAAIEQVGRDGLPAIRAELVGRLTEWGLASDRAEWTVRAWSELLPEPTLPPPPLEPTALPPTPAPTPAPAPSPAPSPAPAPEPTALPTPPPDVTALPKAEPTPAPEPPAEPVAEPRRSARALLGAGAAVVLVVGAGIAGALALTGGDPKGKPGGSASTTPSSSSTPTVSGVTVVAAPEAKPEAATGTFAMAAKRDGVQITALSEVEGPAPEGGKRIGFTLGDWSGCGTGPCKGWKNSALSISVGGQPQSLPEGGPTYAVTLPAGTTEADLVLDANGYRQTLSLLTGQPGVDNITLLGRAKRTVEVDGGTFDVNETTSVTTQLEGRTSSTFVREVSVESAQLVFFATSRKPSAPNRAYLQVFASYRYAHSSIDHGFLSDEVTLTGEDGKPFEKVQFPGGAGVFAFDVPADLANATFTIGGTFPRGSFTATLAPPKSVALSFS